MTLNVSNIFHDMKHRAVSATAEFLVLNLEWDDAMRCDGLGLKVLMHQSPISLRTTQVLIIQPIHVLDHLSDEYNF